MDPNFVARFMIFVSPFFLKKTLPRPSLRGMIPVSSRRHSGIVELRYAGVGASLLDPLFAVLDFRARFALRFVDFHFRSSFEWHD